MKPLYSADDLCRHLKTDYRLVGDARGKKFGNVKPIFEADEFSLVWINPTKAEKQVWAENTKAPIIICDSSLNLEVESFKDKLVVVVPSPKLTFAKIAKVFFGGQIKYERHITSYVHPDADVDPEVYIGPFSYVGRCRIGRGSVIHGHCHLYDGVKVGRNVTIHAGCKIGCDGFGYARDEEGRAEIFPHIGDVVIEDDVDIGANTCIDRGALGSTIIRRGAKIDNLVHIAHNVDIGEDAFVIAQAMIAGSSKVGPKAWIAPSASVTNGIDIGEGATVGLGAVVLKSVPSGETWYGTPAKSAKKK